MLLSATEGCRAIQVFEDTYHSKKSKGLAGYLGLYLQSRLKCIKIEYLLAFCCQRMDVDEDSYLYKMANVQCYSRRGYFPFSYPHFVHSVADNFLEPFPYVCSELCKKKIADKFILADNFRVTEVVTK